jgi:hypothetical protein
MEAERRRAPPECTLRRRRCQFRQSGGNAFALPGQRCRSAARCLPRLSVPRRSPQANDQCPCGHFLFGHRYRLGWSVLSAGSLNALAGIFCLVTAAALRAACRGTLCRLARTQSVRPEARRRRATNALAGIFCLVTVAALRAACRGTPCRLARTHSVRPEARRRRATLAGIFCLVTAAALRAACRGTPCRLARTRSVRPEARRQASDSCGHFLFGHAGKQNGSLIPSQI